MRFRTLVLLGFPLTDASCPAPRTAALGTGIVGVTRWRIATLGTGIITLRRWRIATLGTGINPAEAGKVG